MGPVSFTRLHCGTRPKAMALARRLTALGIRVQLVAQDTAILVPTEDGARSRRVQQELEEDSERP